MIDDCTNEREAMLEANLRLIASSKVLSEANLSEKNVAKKLLDEAKNEFDRVFKDYQECADRYWGRLLK